MKTPLYPQAPQSINPPLNSICSFKGQFPSCFKSQSMMSPTYLHSFFHLPDQSSFRSSSYHSVYSKIMYFAIALSITFLYIICYGSLNCLILQSFYRSHMIILYMNWESTYTQEEMKKKYSLLSL